MEITIKNCNCIDEATVSIETGKLNIKYGMNGTGKSTISKAIELHVKGGDALKSLTPFKHKGSPDIKPQPTVSGTEGIQSIKIFNEDYINQFVFKPDEVLANSFEIFVKTPQYDQRMSEIEKSFLDIKTMFQQNEALEQVISDLNKLSDSFGKSQSGYSEAGALHKGVGKGNKIENIPLGLESYKSFLQSSDNVKWLKWQMGGNDFLDISTDCPYCTSPTTEKKEQILSISKEYDAKSIEHLNNILSILENLGKYFSLETREKLQKITKNKTTISAEEREYLKGVKSNVDVLREKLFALKSMSFFSLKDVDKVIDKIQHLKINIEYLPNLDSEETHKVVSEINSSLDAILNKAGTLQGAVNIQKSNIKKAIEENNKEINTFLTYAGYKYFVSIEAVGEAYKMKLKHKDFSGVVESGSQHLSYGEKNAFSLVLFMYQTMSANPDLIVLDDPISSFDRNKKFAIIDTLFRKPNSFKNKTVLLMTHDFEPIVDMVHNFSAKFGSPTASFLKSIGGTVQEVVINKSDIVTFAKVCKEQVASNCDDIIKLIYLRRHFEVAADQGAAYQLLSNLFHKRLEADCEWHEYGQDIRKMTVEEKDEASKEIEELIAGFDYSNTLANIVDDGKMRYLYQSANNNYEKLQLFRVIKDGTKLHESDVITKYINEAFHIENEYLMQLNPNKYETTPAFIISECDKSLFPQ